VTQLDPHGNEVGRYFQYDGLFAGGEGEPTISGVLAFPEVGFLRCDDPVLWVHPRYGGQFPRAFNDLEMRRAPTAEPEVIVQRARSSELLRNLGFVKKQLGSGSQPTASPVPRVRFPSLTTLVCTAGYTSPNVFPQRERELVAELYCLCPERHKLWGSSGGSEASTSGYSSMTSKLARLTPSR
jgi:hypothetical protein